MTVPSHAAPSPSVPTDSTEGRYPRHEPVSFSGQAGEFFGIWFVNNMLTWMTLGIYSAWAKVRTLQYFYGNTEVAGGAFQFTATPWQILKSRLIAFGLLVVFVIAENYPADWALYVYVGFIAIYLALAPVLTVLVMSFQLRHSTWRGISFRFNKDYRGAYRVYLPPLVMLLLLAGSIALPFYEQEAKSLMAGTPVAQAAETEAMTAPQAGEVADSSSDQGPVKHKPGKLAGKKGMTELDELDLNGYLFIPAGIMLALFLLILPYFDFINQRFLARNVRFGVALVNYSGQASDYYRIYWKWILATALLASLWAGAIGAPVTLGALVWTALIVLSLLYIPLSKAYLKSRRYNLLFGKCDIDHGHFRLHSNVPFLKLAWVLITNSIMVSITFGLMTAWAKVRTARVILESMALEANASLDQFVAAQEEKQSALAEEVADIFDVDVAF
ncbi:YjgN family protein [Marinobacter sp. SS21]|uniref:YjgN family protein n=1 Tax=Marinobacter sp. SS21 TaxID=2979460 RepID=UPI00232D660A|nr:YjgN family protein [Marinobacter sp. SS21]MDC0662085.1 YjgN family protein [Marinobacter sp. SS21]